MSDSERLEKVRKVKEFLNEIRERIDDFTFDQIYMIERGLLSGLPLELIKFSARPEFSAPQMEGIYESYRYGFTLEQLRKYITCRLKENQMREIVFWVKYDPDFEKFVQELGEDLLPKTSYYLIGKVNENLIFGLSWEKIREFIQLCKEKNCLDDDDKIEAINEGILAGLSKEEIDAHIKSEHSSEQVKQIIEELIKKKESEIYKNKWFASFIESLKQSGKFYEEKLREIILGLANGLTIDQVKLYTNEKLDSQYMRMIRLYLQSGYPKEQVEFIENRLVSVINKSYLSLETFARAISFWLRDGLRDGLPLWILDYLIRYSTDPSWLNWWRKKLKSLPRDQIDVYFKKVQFFLTVCKENDLDVEWHITEMLQKLSDDQIETYSWKIQVLAESYRKAGFDSWQIFEIIHGYLDGLSEEQVKLYAKRKFSHHQMREIRLAYLNGLTQEEIEFLANPGFHHSKMRAIRIGLSLGLPLEQVKRFVELGYDDSDIEESILGYLWGLPEEAIEFYMNTKLEIGDYDDAPSVYSILIHYSPKTILRIALLKGLTIPEIEFATRKFLPQNNSQSDDLKSKSLKSTLEELVTNKEARAKIKALKKLNTELTELKENWKKRISETKSGKRKGFTL